MEDSDITDSIEFPTGCKPWFIFVSNMTVRSKADLQHSAFYDANNIRNYLLSTHMTYGIIYLLQVNSQGVVYSQLTAAVRTYFALHCSGSEFVSSGSQLLPSV